MVEANVMGRAAVLNLGGWLLAAQTLSMVTGWSMSHIISDFGGTDLGGLLSAVWLACLAAGAVKVWCARFITYPRASALVERIGMTLMALAIAAYFATLCRDPDGALFVLAMCGASMTNLGGRAGLTRRRDRAVQRVVEAVKDAE